MKPYRNKKYTDWVKQLPCCHCKASKSEPHHLIGIDKMGKIGGKAPDFAAVPLCRVHHNEVHIEPSKWPQTRWLIETLSEAIRQGVIKIEVK